MKLSAATFTSVLPLTYISQTTSVRVRLFFDFGTSTKPSIGYRSGCKLPSANHSVL